MAWTAPTTWTTGQIVTAALMNTHVRDNLNVTAPAVMTTQGDIIYASGANTPARLAKPGTPDGEVLTFASGASAPSWAAPSGGGGIPNPFFY